MTTEGSVVTDGLRHQSASSLGRASFNARRRTGLLSLALVVGAAALLWRIDVWSSPVTKAGLGWWWFAVLSIATELMVFNVEFRREVYTFTFSEIPLVLGLFLASPGDLIVGRLVGAALLLVLKERQSLEKLSLNLSLFFAECVVLVTVYQLVDGALPITNPLSWLEALLAVCLADLLGYVVIAKVVRWHGGPVQLRSILAIGALTAPVNTSFAVVTGLFWSTQPWATLLLAGIGAFLVLSYRSYAALSQRYDSLSLLYDFTRLVSGVQEPDAVLEAILVQAKDLLRAERAEIWLVDDETAYLGLSVDDNGRANRALPSDTGAIIAEWFADSNATIVVTKHSTDPVALTIASAFGVRDCIVAPITEGGRVVGMVAVINRLGEANGFNPPEGPIFATLANHASVALENGRLIVRLHDQAREREHESLHDALTGLPNRVCFDTTLRERLAVLQDTDTLGVAVMDLDGFKDINDTLGHQAGDKVLIEVAHRIASAVDDNVMVARLGGDEFALLFSEPTTRATAERCAREVRRDVALPLHIDGVRINIGVSIGMALAPKDGEAGALLLQRADVAMYGAKSGLGDGVRFYDAEEDANTPRRLTLAGDLGFAVDNNEFHLLYQPKVRLADAELTGFEALLRWNHPRLGPIGPDEFIPLAERTGSIQRISYFVLATALQAAAEWHRGGRRWSISINLSMRNLLDDELVNNVAALIESSGADVELVTLEITETNVMADAGRTIAVLEQLAGLGVRLSIDDFGTGYSSLSYLQRLPVHEIKIDKSFVLPMATDPSAAAIVRSVLDLARNMGLTVVAEGVEDRDTWDLLRTLRCPEAQGYFLAKPMPPNQISDWAETLSHMQLSREDQAPDRREPAPVAVEAT
jgi:diguanylate cyclase (GGDEF)-like protein